METRLVLIPEEEGATYGKVQPLKVNGGNILYGLSVGFWSLSKEDNRVYIRLNEDIDNITHEVATAKSVRAELRQAKKDAEGVEIKPTIEYNPRTKRFKQVYP